MLMGTFYKHLLENLCSGYQYTALKCRLVLFNIESILALDQYSFVLNYTQLPALINCSNKSRYPETSFTRLQREEII